MSFSNTQRFKSTRPMIGSMIAIVALFPNLAGLQSAGGTPFFEDLAAQSGLKVSYFNGMTGDLYLPEVTGGGAALVDYDKDGDLDLYVVQGALVGSQKKMSDALVPWGAAGSPSDRLFRNDLRDGKLMFVDVTEQSRIRAEGYGIGVAVGDVNNDGFPDLYVSNWGPNQLWINMRDGTFRDATSEAGVGSSGFSSSASFLDFDRDGWLDLFVANYVDLRPDDKHKCFAGSSAPDYCGPDAYDPSPDVLFRNKGNGIFEDVTQRSGVAAEYGAGLGVVTADLDGDGWVDIYVANDGDPNQMWINNRDGTFRNEALLAGTALNREGRAEAGMGVDAGDFDGDGDEDIFITHLMQESNTLYVNQGNGFFEDRTIEAGLQVTSLPYTSFGTAWFDFDNDGRLDLLAANGAVRILFDQARGGDPFPLKQPNQLFRNVNGGRFVDVTRQGGPAFSVSAASRGVAFGDIDNDGDSDAVVVNATTPLQLLINEVGNARHWVGLRLVGAADRDMLGARVEAVTEKGVHLWRRCHSDGSYASASDPRVLVGLGEEGAAVNVKVVWPDGTTESWNALPADRYSTLRQGQGASEPLAKDSKPDGL